MNDSEKIQYLFDIAEITKLKAKYGDLVDRAEVTGVEDAKKLAELFADPFELDLRQIDGAPEVITTAEGVVELFGRQLYSQIGWGWHAMANPIIEVDGDTATGQWLVTALATLADNPNQSPPPAIVYGRYRDEYVRTEQGWKFAKVVFHDETRSGEAAGQPAPPR